MLCYEFSRGNPLDRAAEVGPVGEQWNACVYVLVCPGILLIRKWAGLVTNMPNMSTEYVKKNDKKTHEYRLAREYKNQM